jgi:uncharacterized protein
MKVVVDTSVWISGLISPDSSAATVIRLLYEERFELLYNNECLLELSEVSSRKKFSKLIVSQQARALVTLIQQKGTKVRLSKRAETQDPKDDYLLELALSGDAEVLVTLDGKDLLVVGRVGNTRILNTALFLRSLGLTAPKKKPPRSKTKLPT